MMKQFNLMLINNRNMGNCIIKEEPSDILYFYNQQETNSFINKNKENIIGKKKEDVILFLERNNKNFYKIYKFHHSSDNLVITVNKFVFDRINLYINSDEIVMKACPDTFN